MARALGIAGSIMQRARELMGWQRNLALFILGASCLFLFAPFDIWPLSLFVIPLFFAMLDAACRARRAAWDGFWFGYGYFMAGTYWIAISLTVDADQFAWLIPFSLLGLSAVFAIYFVLLGWGYHRLKTQNPVANPFLFSALWVLVEYLRSIGTLGFPWNLVGYSMVDVFPVLQLASLTGVFGLSLLVMLVAMSLVPLMNGNSRCYKQRWIALLLVSVIAVMGCAQYQSSRAALAEDKPIRVRLVQPNIAQHMKWDHAQVEFILNTLAGLTRVKSDSPPPDVIIWPESAVPFLLQEDSVWPERVAQWLPPHAVLLTGVVSEYQASFSNSLIALDVSGEIHARYNKRQLVPFGEFVPLRDILPIQRIVPGSADFSRGASAVAVSVAGIPDFMPMICYESAFPWHAASNTSRPRWLLTITNDAWFGRSPGPYQHMVMSRVRAVEQGLPVIRVANTGISAVIDARGSIVQSLGLGRQGVLDAALPAAHSTTLYARYGEWINLSLLLTILLLVLAYRKTI
jgi:apolipoprotein N-acyltransferase